MEATGRAHNAAAPLVKNVLLSMKAINAVKFKKESEAAGYLFVVFI
jgi:hypothetical protein